MAKLNTQFYKNYNKEPLGQNEKLLSYFLSNSPPNEDYSNLLTAINDYYLDYHFSDCRSSILRWYPFENDCSVLEIGAENGALTGALCDNCGNVVAVEKSLFCAKNIVERYSKRDNLVVYAADYRDIKFDYKFDYIIFFKELECSDNYVATLNYLKTLLTPNGKILFEVENQYGVQYFVGKKETYTGIPFESIAGYQENAKGRGFSRDELITILKKSNFSSWKFYYPLSDCIFPRAIFTEEELPQPNMIERLVIPHEDISTLIADDRQLFIDVVANKVYPFFSNHFIIEASDEIRDLTDIRFVALSGYRLREKAFATIIHSNGIVEKKGLFPNGSKYARHLLTIYNDLKKQDIPILELKLRGNSLFMNYVDNPTVQLHLNHLVESDAPKAAVIEVFDILWKYILKSSKIEDEHCYKNGIDLGPVLEKAYLEMVSINSFWQNGKILFFDQEICRENYPAKYIIFRSIQMFIGMIKGAEKKISKQELLEHFGISNDVSDYFSWMEFQLDQDENPKQIVYNNYLDSEQLRHRRMQLAGDVDGK